MKGGDIMDFNWGDLVFLTAVVYALTNAIKTATKDKLGYWYMLIAIALGFGAIYFATYAPDIIKAGFVIGVGAAGIYDFRTGK